MLVLCRKLAQSALCRSHVKISQQMAHTFDGADESEGNELNVGKFGSFTVFRINRPEKRNCLNYSTAVKLKEALNKFNNDILSSVGIILGEGGNFCSGLDLNELANDSKFYQKFLELGLMDEFSKKPLIAAVNGYAVGTGFDLALWCDLRVVEDTAIFGYFNQRFGVPLAEGSVRRLVQLVGRARAIDWVLTGRIVRANEAFQAGIVSRLVACGTAYGQTVALAKSIEKYPFSCTMWNRINLLIDSFPADEQVKMLNQKDILLPSVEEKIVNNAKRFVDGFGRHGKSTNLKNSEVKIS